MQRQCPNVSGNETQSASCLSGRAAAHFQQPRFANTAQPPNKNEFVPLRDAHAQLFCELAAYINHSLGKRLIYCFLELSMENDTKSDYVYICANARFIARLT